MKGHYKYVPMLKEKNIGGGGNTLPTLQFNDISTSPRTLIFSFNVVFNQALYNDKTVNFHVSHRAYILTSELTISSN